MSGSERKTGIKVSKSPSGDLGASQTAIQIPPRVRPQRDLPLPIQCDRTLRLGAQCRRHGGTLW
ncbi:hypothetical protein CHISP_1115 [Chitinispirillum alkaliphilum]|nr:hypothetical protein CHISP_1115 [Chitinispirillum alkaliphilum]